MANPAAGRGRIGHALAQVLDTLAAGRVGVSTILGRDPANAEQLCRQAVADGTEALVAVGGDGTLSIALQAVAGTDTPLGIVPAGSGNDLAGGLGLPVHNALAAIDIVLAGHTRRIDAVSTDRGRWWAGVLGAGFDGLVAARAERMRWPAGTRRYDAAVLAELPTFRPRQFDVTLDGRRLLTEAMLIAVGNNSRYGGGMRICPAAVLDDGLLEVTVLGAMSRVAMLRAFPAVYRGTAAEHPRVSTHRAREVRVDSTGLSAYADGERLGPLPVTSTCVPAALRVLTAAPPA